MSRKQKYRIGAVSYLNTKPLVFQLKQLAPEMELIFDLPSRLADRLAVRDLDLALIPSIECFQNADYTIVSDACIGCRGPVLSVKLFSRVPLDRIQTLALDEGSRTSIALTRILLRERFGREPACESLPIGGSAQQAQTDAVLLIGDRAMHAPHGEFVECWDLGEEWNRWAGLPFVFAMWVGRRDKVWTDLDSTLRAARDTGVAHLNEIAQAEAARVGLTVDACLRYLRDNLYFFLGSRERQGLELFRQHAQQLGLAPRTSSPLNFASTCSVVSSA